MKRAVIVHCWGGTHDYAWYPRVAAQLREHGYAVEVPDMPNTEEPHQDIWVPYLRQCIGEPDDGLVLIGHSIGTVTIMRYLEALPAGKQINKAVLVAAFTDQLGFKELENFFDTRLDFDRIKDTAKNGFVLIQSSNDPYVSAQYGTRLKEELDAKLIIKPNAGHMSGEVDNEASCTNLPEVLENL